MATVYRVEMRDGLGPYSFREAVESFYADLQKAHGYCGEIDTHPAGYDDIPDLRAGKHLFAFPSLELLHKWFDGFLDRIMAVGGVIKVYEVADHAIIMGISGLQLAFDQNEARFLCVHSSDGLSAIGS
jgi:hypothetical protein